MVAYLFPLVMLFLSGLQSAQAEAHGCNSTHRCGQNQGDCDSHSDCKIDFVCGINNCHDISGVDNSHLPSYADCCVPRICSAVSELTWDCCKSGEVECDIGWGDCDDDGDCSGSLVCGVNNCGAGSPAGSDCCMEKGMNGGPRDFDFCTSSSKCSLNQGDCDSDNDCEDDLVCGHDNCRDVNSGNINATADCCVAPLKKGTKLDMERACSSSNECEIGQGDCDSDEDCSGTAVCGVNNCPATDAEAQADCCVAKECSGGAEDWHCCSSSSKCSDGEGDCDTHDDCDDGLFCGVGNCNTDAGFVTGQDCCYYPDCDGSKKAFNCCTKDHPCQLGQGDCDVDADCAGSLVCGINNRQKLIDANELHFDPTPTDADADFCENP